MVFGVSYTMLSQRSDDDPPVPGGPDSEGPIGPVGQVSELFSILVASDGEALDLLEEYLDDGCDPNTTDEKGISALQWAILSSDVSMVVHGQVEQLLRAGANPNATDRQGRTPLHYAANFGGSGAVVTALINAGGNPEMTDSEGLTPLDRALFSGNASATAALERAARGRPQNYDAMKTHGILAKKLEDALVAADSRAEQEAAVDEWIAALIREKLLLPEQAQTLRKYTLSNLKRR